MLIVLVQSVFFVRENQNRSCYTVESMAAPVCFGRLFLNHVSNSITRKLDIKVLISDDYFV